ncbi:MAG: sigma-54-dependent Fis family transcriptional regulator [Nitrospirales bacterium]|nr:sigma-54-dependent Fis family transcriptional regulator [Nitrospira sp.]MDR4500996.1 sigma-54-dependent Fis family transcriptional regulator [Nitrospirales bacterium]
MSITTDRKLTGADISTPSLQSVLSLCRKMRTEQELPSLLLLIAKEAKQLLAAQDASLLLLDRDLCELWSYVALDGETIRFDARLGIAGAAVLNREVQNVPDVQHDSRFYDEVDLQAKKKTRNLLAIPLQTHEGEVLGVLEIINKKGGSFTSHDESVAITLAEQAVLSIESTRTVQELKQQRQHLIDENAHLRKEVERRFATQNLIGVSPPIQSIVRLIDQIRDTAVDVLITGESGTGKELVAKAIHDNSMRRQKPFVALNCAAIPEPLVESELFGIQRGVATGVEAKSGKFEQANEGTLFLDEIGDLSLNAQAKILRVLQERTLQPVGGRTDRTLDVRVLAATNQQLDDSIKKGAFRKDLYYRLKVVHIHTPSLRDIPEDIPLLAAHFLTLYCQRTGKEEKRLTMNAQRLLQTYAWPGNVRELENEMKRIVATQRRIVISEPDLDATIRSQGRVTGSRLASSLPRAVAQLEEKMIRDALRACHFNQVQTAKRLGISRQGLIKKMKRLGILTNSGREE